MTVRSHDSDAARSAQARGSGGRRALRWLGWVLVLAGTVVLLYLVYALWFTGLETEREQAALLDTWEREVGSVGADSSLVDEGTAEDPEVEVGDAVAVLAFERPGSDDPPVRDEPVAVVEGVSVADLERGPGHYPESAAPGADGNFAVAGHRVTYSAPFYALEELMPDDLVHVWDRNGDHHVYEVRGSEIVLPTETWVLDSDPLELDAPTLTLTTCHPRYSDRERMISFAELVS